MAKKRPATSESQWQSTRYEELVRKLDHPWPAPKHSYVAKETDLHLGHITVTLLPDGTYFLTDESGG